MIALGLVDLAAGKEGEVKVTMKAGAGDRRGRRRESF
jgi:hypothetical protein